MSNILLKKKIEHMYKVKRFSSEKSNDEKKLNREELTALAVGGGSIGANSGLGTLLAKTEGGPFKIKDEEKLAKKVKEQIAKEGLTLRKSNLMENIQLKGQKNAFYSPKTKEVIDAGLGHKADILAHELGHHKVQSSKNALIRGTQGSVGNVARIGAMTGGTAIGSYLAGRVAGKAAAKEEFEGRKESKASKYGHHAVALGANLPILASEAMASGHGLKILKNAGASKKDLAKAAGNLAVAAGTYTSMAGLSEGMAMLGKAQAKKKLAKLRKRSEKSDSKRG